MLVKYNTAVNRIVDIVLRDKEFAIIKSHKAVPGESETGGNNTGGIDSDNTVNLYDTYIINPDNIEEGDIIDR